jgi:hypothetical protein
VDWDDEVDIVCTRSGIAGLASAISAVDLGGQVFIGSAHAIEDGTGPAVAVRSRTHRLHPWLTPDSTDPETLGYFAALTSDVGPLGRDSWDVGVPVRAVEAPIPVKRRAPVRPFIGARLREWTARCLASPSGYLYTRVSDWQSTTFSSHDGDSIEVAEIGSMTPDPDDVARSVFEWLTAQARDRWIDVAPNCSFQRIVFEEGEVVGAVFTTPEGPLAIRARHGVHVAADAAYVQTAGPQELPAVVGPLRVCLVGRLASRFGRVELLTSEPMGQSALACRPVNRGLQASLRETHAHLQTWRCGKVDGDSPLGQ